MTLQTNLLKGELIYLDAVTKDDLPVYLPWANDIAFKRLADDEFFRPMTIEQQEEWYKGIYKGNSHIPFAIRTLKDNLYIGGISAADINWQARHCMVGITIGDKNYWGKGYGTEAMRVFLRYAFMEMNMNRVGLEVISYNERAIKSYEKVGFTREATLRQTVWRDGNYYNTICMGILRDEWQES